LFCNIIDITMGWHVLFALMMLRVLESDVQ
jgi:hypothetical protein